MTTKCQITEAPHEKNGSNQETKEEEAVSKRKF